MGDQIDGMIFLCIFANIPTSSVIIRFSKLIFLKTYQETSFNWILL